MQTFSLFCTKKNYFFYFTHLFLQNTYINQSILHIYSIKYSFFYNFLLFPHSLPLSLTYPTLLKNTKILNARATALVHLCTILHQLMWVFFGSKCAYLNTFSILHYFSLTNASALMFINYKDPAKSKSSKFPLVLSNFFNCFAGQSYRVNHGQLLYSSALYYIYYQVPTNPINLALLLICMRKRLLLGSLIKVSFNDSEKSMSMLQDSNLH